MSFKNDFALVPKLPGALEKAESGSKRIVSGMVADTLALAKPTKPPCSVLLLNDGIFDELWEVILKGRFGQKYNLRFTRFKRASELLMLTQKETFELIIMYHGNVLWDVPDSDAFDLLASLKYGKRIIVTQGWDLSEQCTRAGVSFVDSPVTLEQAQAAIRFALDAPRLTDTLALVKKDGQAKLKIILVDDESWLREWLSSLIQTWFPEVALSSFENGSEAWNEIVREAPDLLITDMNRSGLNGWKMLPMLEARKPNYHVLVHSGGADETGVRKCAGPNLKLTFLSKPWNAEEFCRILSALLGREPDSGSLASPGELANLQAKVSPVATKFRIGEYEWCEPDYRQILMWAKGLKMKPEDVVDSLFDANNKMIDSDGKQLRLLPFFDEPLMANGRLLKISWDLRRMPCDTVEWFDGLEITHLRFIGGLEARSRCLTDIGRMALPQLVWLYCSWQKLHALDLSGTPKLQHLQCNCNRLRSLRLDAVPDLRELVCESNQIDELNLLNTRKLSFLDCSNNNLVTLDLSGLRQLDQVLCDGNALTELKLLELPLLVDLSCIGNELEALDLSQAPFLESLDCSENRIWQLDLSNCRQLKSLDCQGNPIRELDITSLSQLETLHYDSGRTRLIQGEDQHFDIDEN